MRKALSSFSEWKENPIVFVAKKMAITVTWHDECEVPRHSRVLVVVKWIREMRENS